MRDGMKTYRKERKKYLNLVNQARRKEKMHVFVLTILGIAIIGYSTIFTIDMNRKNAQAAKKYVMNYADQRGRMLDVEIGSGEKALQGLKESVESKKTLTDMETFLEGKMQSYQFDFIALYNVSTGNTTRIGELSADLKLEEGIQNVITQAEKSTDCIVQIQGEQIIYAINCQISGQEQAVLLAGDSTDELQEMITTESFDRKSSSLIVDEKGQVLVSSKTKDLSGLWEDLLQEDTDTELKKQVQEMEEEFQNGESGVFGIHPYKGNKYYLAYVPAKAEKWAVITIVPSNLLSGFADQYACRMFISLGGTLLLFGIYSVLLLRNYGKEGERLEQLAFLDYVTGGINRSEFCLRYELLCRKKIANQYAIVFLDAVDFGRINEVYGVHKGDQMLRHFYQTIKKQLREAEGEFVARSEMDHMFLCIKEHDQREIQKRMESIIEKINEFRGTNLPKSRIAFRIGVSLIENNKTEITTIQDRARTALKVQEAGEKNTCNFYNAKMEERMKKEREVDNLFETAILERQFEVYFQPQVSLSKGRAISAEALVRWNRPKVGLIPPNEFIPILEANGKICTLDQYIFERVCIWQAKRKKQGKAQIPIAVNLSRSHFLNIDFVDRFAKIAKKYEVDYSLIEFEVTETIFLDELNIEKVKEGIQKMHQYGFRCAIDDFGVGYSSLTMIREFDIDVLKLDRAFFHDLHSNKARNVLRCVAGLAASLDIVLVAEGIETEEQIRFLKMLRCDIVQGYYFSKPLPEDMFEKWMEESADSLKKYCEDDGTLENTGGGYKDVKITYIDQEVL